MSARLSLARIFAVCAGSASVDLIIAVGGAYFAPVLYDGDVVSGEYGSMLLVFSPLLVLVFQNYLGSASDRCSLRWGRRKPFILALTVLFLLGLTLFPFADDLTNLSDNSGVQQWIFIVTILTSTTLIDFNVLSIQVPLRAFLLDVLLPQQVVTGNLVYPMLALLGATVGFGIGSVNWSSIFGLSNSLSIQLKFVCGFSILITISLTLITLCSVKEQLPQQDGEVKQGPSDLTPNTTNVNHGDEKKATAETSSSQNFLEVFLSYDNITRIPYGGKLPDTPKEHNNCCAIYNSVVDNICFIRFMSSSTAVLFLSVFFIMVVFTSQMIFFTHYVGEVIFNGDVFAPENSTAYKNYTDGIKMGSLILAVSSTSGFFMLLLLRPAIKYLGIRLLFILPFILMMVQSSILIITHNLIVAIILSPAIYTSLLQYLTFPHILILMYQTEGLLLRRSWPYSYTNLMGRSCSLIIIASQLGKITSLMLNGPLMVAYGSAVSVMIFTCVCSFMGALVACFVTVPSVDNKEKNKSNMKTHSSSIEQEHQVSTSQSAN